ncbi:hypothetical protein FDECE_11679 [Fusarium decemcellulare]|nr:hypothetical protein FDECE_11679 [Fusarium decemcellulare]
MKDPTSRNQTPGLNQRRSVQHVGEESQSWPQLHSVQLTVPGRAGCIWGSASRYSQGAATHSGVDLARPSPSAQHAEPSPRDRPTVNRGESFIGDRPILRDGEYRNGSAEYTADPLAVSLLDGGVASDRSYLLCGAAVFWREAEGGKSGVMRTDAQRPAPAPPDSGARDANIGPLGFHWKEAYVLDGHLHARIKDFMPVLARLDAGST